MEMGFAEHVLDAVDIETLLKCDTEADARRMVIEWLKSLGLNDVDVVFLEHTPVGTRVRARAYLYRPGDRYPWLSRKDGARTEGGSVACEG